MAGYFGTEAQRRLQAQAEAGAAFIAATPGACQTGRMMASDDPDRFGWPLINASLRRDGVFGFRLIPAAKAEDLRSRLAERDCRFDVWDVFIADRGTAVAACEAVLARGLPEGMREVEGPLEAEGEAVAGIQALMAGAGVAPFSGSMLAGRLGPAVTVAVADRGGTLVAAAHACLPHNAHSPFHRHAWGGLVAVSPAWRGAGLGRHVNARMVLRAFRELGATAVYELVAASNVPSRRMVEACGLRFTPEFVCGVATAAEAARFTR